MWLFEKETNDKISLEKYLPSAKMHEYAIPAVLETVFEAEWLRREGVFFFLFRERKDHENDLEMTRLKVNCKDSARIGKKRQEFDRKIRLRGSRQMENDDGNLENDRRGNRLPSLIRIRRILPPYHTWIFETFVSRVYRAWLDFITFRIVMDSVRNSSSLKIE